MAWTKFGLTTFVCLWSAVLVLQNFAVIYRLKEAFAADPIVSNEGKIALAHFTLKPVLVFLTGSLFFRRKRRSSAAAFCLAMLYAFPLGRFVDQIVLPFLPPPNLTVLMSFSALLAYAAVASILGLQVMAERKSDRQIA